MQESLGIDDLLLPHVDQLKSRNLPSWPQRRARLEVAQAAFGIDFHANKGDGAMRMLLQSTAYAHLAACGPLSGYLEAGLIQRRIDESDPALRLRAQIAAIDAQVATTEAMCLELMRTLFWMVFEPRRTEVPLDELRAACFANIDQSVDWDPAIARGGLGRGFPRSSDGVGMRLGPQLAAARRAWISTKGVGQDHPTRSRTEMDPKRPPPEAPSPDPAPPPRPLLRARVVVEPKSFTRTDLGSVIGEVYILVDETAFPSKGWTDFVDVVVGWWQSSLPVTARSRGRTQLQFLDGPDKLFVAAGTQPGGALIQDDRGNTLGEGDLEDFRDGVHAADRIVLAEYRARGWLGEAPGSRGGKK